MSSVLWHEGRFTTPGEARLALDDPGYLLGDGVFATMRGYGGVCFRPAVHLADFARGAAMLGIELREPIENLARLANEAAARTGLSEAYVRVTLTRGPVLSILARSWDKLPSDDDFANGVDAVVVKTRRMPASCMDPTVKTTSQAPQIVARREAGGCEAIMLSVDGALACGGMSNLFLVKDDALVTPSLESGCRNGVTRRAVIELARAQGIDVVETRLERAALATADEVFLTSTRVECLPIARIDGARIGRGGLTARLRRMLRDLVRAETLASA